MSLAWVPVVAAAIARDDGRWLMHRRPLEKHHGGLWEFPGGKIEAFETPIETLERELAEELGISVSGKDCEPLFWAEERAQSRTGPIVILLYKVSAFTGNPLSLEGGAVGWFLPGEAQILPRPPLDELLCRRLFALPGGEPGR